MIIAGDFSFLGLEYVFHYVKTTLSGSYSNMLGWSYLRNCGTHWLFDWYLLYNNSNVIFLIHRKRRERWFHLHLERTNPEALRLGSQWKIWDTYLWSECGFAIPGVSFRVFFVHFYGFSGCPPFWVWQKWLNPTWWWVRFWIPWNLVKWLADWLILVVSGRNCLTWEKAFFVCIY